MVSCTHLCRSFQGPSGTLRVLDDVSLSVARGEWVSIRGASGSGKTTLLMTLGGMARPDSGSVSVDGADLYALGARARARTRGDRIGFVFQLFHLVPYLSVRENVLAGLPGSVDTAARQKAQGLLEELGLTSRADHRPATLSAGERQRTALARALLKNPAVIFADEPTGNLDPENALNVLHRLDRFRRKGGTVLLVTHGTEAAAFADRTLHLRNGRLSP